MRLRGLSALVGLALLPAAAFVWGQAKAPAGAGKPPQQSKPTQPWELDVEDLLHNDRTHRGEAHKVTVTTDEGAVIRADLFTYDDGLKTAQASGHLTVADKDLDGSAARVDLEYGRGRKVMTLAGPVHAVIKPRPATDEEQPARSTGGSGDGKSERLRSKPIAVDCDRVVYQYSRETKHAVLSGNLRAVQQLDGNERTLTAASAEWFGLEDRLVLKAPVKFVDQKGRKGESDQDVEIGTREGNETLHMRKGKFQLPADDDEESGTAPPTATGGRGKDE